MMCIQAHDLTLDECLLLRSIIINNYTLGEDYRNTRPSSPFLQGYEEPRGSLRGWVLVEFWTRNQAAVNATVNYINEQFASDRAHKF